MAVNIGPTIGLDGESDFRNQLKNVNSALKTLGSEMKKVNSEFKDNSKSGEALAAKNKVLTDSIKKQEEHLAKANEMLEKSKEIYGENSVQALKWQEVVNNSETSLNNLKNQLKENEKALEEWENSIGSGNQALGEFSKAIGNFGDKAIKIGKDLTKYLTTAIAGIGVAAGKSAKELDEGYDTIVTKTGATGDALEELQDIADNVFSKLPTDMNKVGVAVGEINTRFGVTGDTLEGLSEEFLKFAEINEVDLNDSIGKVDKIMEQFNVDMSQTQDLLGLVTKRAQETGIGVDKLLDSVQKNGATFRDMGLGVEESINLLAQFEAKGVNAETALMGLKRSVVEYAKEGLSADEALRKTIESLKNASSETEALSKAQEIFGTRGAAEMVSAIRDGRINLDDLSDSMSNYGDVVSNTFASTQDPWDNAKVMMNNLKVALKELGGTLFEILNPLIEAATDKIKKFSKWFKGLNDTTKKAIVYIGGIVSIIGPALLTIGKISKIISVITGDLSKVNSVIKKVTSATKLSTAATAANTTVTVAGTTATTGATGAFAAFNAVLKANPIMAVIGAIGLLVGAFALFDSAVKNSNSESAKFRRELEQANETMEDYQESMSEIKTRQDETIAEGTAEISHYQQLKAELDGLIDKNGKVKKGYEERAQFIATTLNDSLGTEIKMTDGVISGYEKVSESIDKLIEKKKAQIIMEAREEEYTKAIKEQNNLIDAAATKYEALSRAQEEYQRDYEKLDGRQRQIRESNLKTLEADYKQAANLVKENSDTIKGYEGDMAEFLKGNYNEISYSAKTTYSNIDKLSREEAQKEIKTLRDKAAELRKLAAETGDQAIAQRAADYEAEALQLQKHLDNLGDTVESDTQVTSAAKKLGNESAYQFEEGFDGKNLGQAAIKGIASGMSTSKSALTNAAASAVNTLTSAFRNKLKINSPSKLMRDKVGKSITEGIAVGMEEEIPMLAKANSNIVKTVSGIRMGTVSADMANKNNSSSVLNSIPTNIGENKVINNVIYNVLDGKIISKTVQNDITKNQMAVMRMKGALI